MSLNEISVRLVQNLKFKAKTKTKNCSRIVKHVNYSSIVKAHSVLTWDTSHLIIPPICPNSNEICKIVKIKYSLVLTIGTIDSKNFDLSIPITIGSVPLRESFQVENLNQFSEDLPSYETCMFGTSFNSETSVGLNSEVPEFTPSYPVYKNSTRY